MDCTAYRCEAHYAAPKPVMARMVSAIVDAAIDQRTWRPLGAEDDTAAVPGHDRWPKYAASWDDGDFDDFDDLGHGWHAP